MSILNDLEAARQAALDDRAGRLAAELRVLRDDAAAVLGPTAAADLDLLAVACEMAEETEAARLGRDDPGTELEI